MCMILVPPMAIMLAHVSSCRWIDQCPPYETQKLSNPSLRHIPIGHVSRHHQRPQWSPIPCFCCHLANQCSAVECRNDVISISQTIHIPKGHVSRHHHRHRLSPYPSLFYCRLANQCPPFEPKNEAIHAYFTHIHVLIDHVCRHHQSPAPWAHCAPT